MKFLEGDDWIGMACETRNVPHSSVAAECANPLGASTDAELIHDLLTQYRDEEELPAGRRR